MNIMKLFGSVALEGADKVGSQLSELDVKGSKSSKVLDGIGNAGKIAAAGLAGIATAIGTVTAAAVGMASVADNVDKMSQKIGISREAFQEWDFILSQSGASISSLQTGMKTLSTAADEAASGNKTYSESFERLGVSVTDTNGQMKDQEQIFSEVFASLSSMENQTERTALASQLLGRSATELAPAFNAGAESIEDMRNKAHDLGLVMGDEAIDAGVKLTDTIDQLKRTFSALTMEALAPFMDDLSGLGDALLGVFKGDDGAGEDLANSLSSTIQTALDAIVDMVPKFLDIGVSVIMSLIEGITSDIGSITDAAIGIVLSLVDSIITNLPMLLTAAIDIIVTLANGIVDAVPEIVKRIPELMESILVAIIDNLPTILLAGIEIVLSLAEGLIKAIPTFVTYIPRIITSMVTAFSDAIPKFLTMGQDIIDGLVQGIKDFAMKPVDAVVDAGKKVVDGFKNFFGIRSPSKLFKGFGKNFMEGLANGIEENVSLVEGAFKYVGDIAKGVGEKIVGSSNILGGAADAWESSQTDPETGEKKATVDLAGGITGVLTSLITSSSQFGELMEAINPILQKVADFFGRLLTPLIPIVSMIADALMPLLNLLEPTLMHITWVLEKVVTPIIQFLSNLIITIYNTIAGVFNWILGILDSLPFVNIKYRLPTAENTSPATATTEEETSNSGGTQISEITGATRDLLTSLLSPLSSLDSLTGIGNRIYDLLEDRLVGGVTIGTINVTPRDGENVSDATAREIEEAISERLAFMGAL